MSGKNIIILGGSESGTGAAVLAAVKGYDVFVSDSKFISPKYKEILKYYNVPFEEGKHSSDMILQADEVVKSPGIPDSVEIVQKIYSHNIPIVSEIEFASRFNDTPVIAITGSNGKTTTTLLIHHILTKAGCNAGIAGNIGNSFAFQVATGTFDIYVVEVSSFQLDNCFDFAPNIAILLNITPDHLYRYDFSMEKYVASKFRIVQNLTKNDAFIYSADDSIIRNYINKNKEQIHSRHYPFSLSYIDGDNCGYVKNNRIIIKTNKSEYSMKIKELALQGKHNLYDSMAASIACRLLDIKSKLIQASLSDFTNAEHRLEFVADVHGIAFVNDSKATNVNSAWYALESVSGNIIWIAGGQDKGNDYSILFDMVQSKVKALICLGTDNSVLKKTFKGIIPTIIETDNMWDAVSEAYKIGKQGDTVLLSPACASFDLFENYEDRGNQFKMSVKNL